MTKLRLDEPNITILAKKRSDAGRFKPIASIGHTLSQIRRKNGVFVSHVYPKTKYCDLPKEEKARLSARSVKWYQNKRKTSPRFRNHKNRQTSAYIYSKLGEVKLCRGKCGKVRGITDFDLIKDPKKGKKVRRPYCRHCRKEMNRVYWAKRKAKQDELLIT